MRVPESAAGKTGTCKKCGASITVPMQFSSSEPQVAVATAPPRQRVQTIQATSKKWKLMQLLGGLGAVGFVSYGVAQGSTAAPGADISEAIAVSILGFAFSVFLLLTGRFFAWWFHG